MPFDPADVAPLDGLGPLAPAQVLLPRQVPKGVGIMQPLLPPCVLASQSHAPEDGRHCLKAVPPTVTLPQV